MLLKLFITYREMNIAVEDEHNIYLFKRNHHLGVKPRRAARLTLPPRRRNRIYLQLFYSFPTSTTYTQLNPIFIDWIYITVIASSSEQPRREEGACIQGGVDYRKRPSEVYTCAHAHLRGSPCFFRYQGSRPVVRPGQTGWQHVSP